MNNGDILLTQKNVPIPLKKTLLCGRELERWSFVIGGLLVSIS